jgi:hypothetical protein
MERRFWTSFFFPVRCGFIYPATSTAKTAAFGRRLKRKRYKYTITWSEFWCVMRHMTKSGNRLNILGRNCQLGTLLCSDSLRLHWTFKWWRNFPWLPLTMRCYCTHSSCFIKILRDVLGERIVSKDIWPPRPPVVTSLVYYMWGEMRVSVYKDNLYTLSLN